MTPEERFVAEHLPAALQQIGPRGLFYWQWLALPLLGLVAWGAGAVAGRVVEGFLGRVVKRTDARWDDALVDRLHGPITLLTSAIVAMAIEPMLRLAEAPDRLLDRTLKTLAFVAFFWGLFRVVDIIGELLLQNSAWAQANPASKALVPLGGRIAKVAVAAVAVVAVLSSLGYPVASLLAGLGIGGLAVALAAQKTFENLFGAFAVGVDQPFREGDAVKIDDLVGTIERVGLRSTRIRTLDRTVVTLPNGQIAEKRIESYAERDRFRLATVLPLERTTSASTVRAVTDDVRALLLAQDGVVVEDVVARVLQISASALDVEVAATYRREDWNDFAAMRANVLLSALDIVERRGAALAYPTQTVQVRERPVPAGAPTQVAPEVPR